MFPDIEQRLRKSMIQKIFRSHGFEKSKIGIVVDVWKHYPSRPGNSEDEELAKNNNEIEGYGIFHHPLFHGGYSKELNHLSSRI